MQKALPSVLRQERELQKAPPPVLRQAPVRQEHELQHRVPPIRNKIEVQIFRPPPKDKCPEDERPPPLESNVTQSKHLEKDEPSFEQALAGPDAVTWKQAMLEELQSIERNKVWKESPLPLNRRALGTKWVFLIKRDAQGNIQKYKARLVVQGFGQQFGFDYEETYAPVIRIDNVRLLFAIGAFYQDNGVVMWHIDFNNAFQNGNADYQIYIRQPPGFVNPRFPHHVLLLLNHFTV